MSGRFPAAEAQGSRDLASRIYRVGELNAELRTYLESTYPVVWLEGEISNFRCFSASGHWYFTLKDEAAQIAAAMFKSRNRRVRFRPEDGMHVLVRGTVSLYEPRGTYQIIVSRIEPRGAGALHAAFEQLKTRLAEEGLFDAARKRPLPVLPRRVGIVTSAEGAALRDILRILRLRHAGVSALVIPCRVQGEGAAEEIAQAIERAGCQDDLDVLIVGRGGGSLEDLWAFNEEIVARAIAACPLPVISAVGHEVDVTIADFVADHRAPTPSAAAESVVASREEMREKVRGLSRRLAGSLRLTLSRLQAGPAGRFALHAAGLLEARLRRSLQRVDEATGRFQSSVHRRLIEYRHRLGHAAARLSPATLAALCARQRDQLHAVHQRLAGAAQVRLRESRLALGSLAGRLDALSPLAVLERGYALARLAGTGAVVRDARQAPPGTAVEVRLHRGGLDVKVVKAHPLSGGGQEAENSRRNCSGQ